MSAARFEPFERFGSPGRRFAEAFGSASASPRLLHELWRPKRVVEFRYPLKLDDGTVEVLDAVRICYSDRRGPSKGGVRFIPRIQMEPLLSLSFLMTIKCAVNDLPHGGAAGAVAIDPASHSDAELARAARGYVEALFPLLGETVDILSPDLNTNAALMAEMSAEYDRLAGRPVPGAINGKPPERGGSFGRHGATARAAACVLGEFLARRHETVAGQRVAIQGFGNAGGTLALELHRLGAKVVAVCDSQAGLHSRAGLDIPRLITACAGMRKTDVKSIPAADAQADPLDPARIFEVDADVVAPAAVADQINPRNAGSVRAGVVLEIANGATEHTAEKSLLARGVTILPDVLANAGGVTVSHFEWAQNRAGQTWTVEEVHQRLLKRVRRLANEVLDAAERSSRPLTVAAHSLAVDRLAS